AGRSMLTEGASPHIYTPFEKRPKGRMTVDQNEQAKIADDEPPETTLDTATAQPARQDVETQERLAAFWAAGGTFGMALRDGLAPVQQEGTAAARMSGEHISNLLYGVGAAERHTAPYTGRDYPNANDYRDEKRR